MLSALMGWTSLCGPFHAGSAAILGGDIPSSPALLWFTQQPLERSQRHQKPLTYTQRRNFAALNSLIRLIAPDPQTGGCFGHRDRCARSLIILFM
jgi:hypothetical protein